MIRAQIKRIVRAVYGFRCRPCGSAGNLIVLVVGRRVKPPCLTRFVSGRQRVPLCRGRLLAGVARDQADDAHFRSPFPVIVASADRLPKWLKS